MNAAAFVHSLVAVFFGAVCLFMADSCRSDDLTDFHTLGVSCRPKADVHFILKLIPSISRFTVLFGQIFDLNQSKDVSTSINFKK